LWKRIFLPVHMGGSFSRPLFIAWQPYCGAMNVCGFIAGKTLLDYVYSTTSTELYFLFYIYGIEQVFNAIYRDFTPMGPSAKPQLIPKARDLSTISPDLSTETGLVCILFLVLLEHIYGQSACPILFPFNQDRRFCGSQMALVGGQGAAFAGFTNKYAGDRGIVQKLNRVL